MQPDRWQLIDRIFHSALELPEERRSAFVAESCSNDDVLRGEVEALLARHCEADGFLEQPAWEIAAQAAGTGISGASATVDSRFIGETIAHYRIVRPLGSGGMGVVYEAEDVRLRRRVALKFLHGRLAGDPRAHQRLEREARAASSLNHPNICSIHGVEEHVGQPVIVMELLQGESLKERIRCGPLAVSEILELGLQAADALQTAHAHGIVHRDIKPANLLVTPEGRLKILDFGLAKVMPVPAAHDLTIGDSLTCEGVIAGTAAYMSPEQARGEELDARSDLFSFGVLLYELATGRQPFKRNNAITTIDAVLNSRPPAPTTLNPLLPAAFDAIIARLLEKAPGSRYPDAASVRADLLDVQSKPGALRFRAWRKGAVIGAVCLGALAIAAAVIHGVPRDHPINTVVASFDPILRREVIDALARAPHLRLLPEDAIPNTAAPENATHSCREAGASLLVEGSIVDLDPRRLISLRARDCAGGDILDEAEAQSGNAEGVPAAINDAAGRLAAGLKPVRLPAAPSSAAVEAFTAARNVVTAEGARAGLPLLRRAIEIDPGLAIAQSVLARAYSELDQSDLAAESARRSWRLRNRATEQDRFFIDIGYINLATGNLDQAQQVLETWIRTYPRDPYPAGLLGSVYKMTGQFDKALAATRKSRELKPDLGMAFYNEAADLSYLNRFAEARVILREAYQHGLDLDEFLMLAHDLAFLADDRRELDTIVSRARGKSVAENWISAKEARVLAWAGRLRESRSVSSRAVEQARHAGQPERAGLWEAGAAVREALYGNSPEAAARAFAALELSRDREVEYAAALAFAFSGDSRRSQLLADEMERRFPEDTAVRFAYSPVLRARIALNGGDAARALEVLQMTVSLEMGVQHCTINALFGALYPVYLRGQSYLAAHRGLEAATEFRKIIARPGIVVSDPVGVLASLQLARAQALAGDKQNARAAYRAFLTLWRGADPDIPILKQARAEYIALR
jgi:eukaryotic-like serine/threonine-protein kinase